MGRMFYRNSGMPGKMSIKPCTLMTITICKINIVKVRHS